MGEPLEITVELCQGNYWNCDRIMQEIDAWSMQKSPYISIYCLLVGMTSRLKFGNLVCTHSSLVTTFDQLISIVWSGVHTSLQVVLHLVTFVSSLTMPRSLTALPTPCQMESLKEEEAAGSTLPCWKTNEVPRSTKIERKVIKWWRDVWQYHRLVLEGEQGKGVL